VSTAALAILLSALISTFPISQSNPQDAVPKPPLQPASQPTIEQPAPGSNYISTKGFVLEDGTPVKLRINRTVSSADAHVGDTVDFEVLEDVSVNSILVVPKGGLAFATVTEAQAKRRMARGGKLDINIDNVRLVDGEKAALRAVKDMKGGGHTGAMVGGMVATSLVFFPAAPFFLFMHGKDITIPKGTEVTGYINGDMKLDIAKFQPPSSPRPASVAEAAPPVANLSTAKLQIESVPPGADIEVDGSFVGNSPSEIEVSGGEHVVTVKKTGFKDWKRNLKVSGGSSVHLNAELQKMENPQGNENEQKQDNAPQ